MLLNSGSLPTELEFDLVIQTLLHLECDRPLPFGTATALHSLCAETDWLSWTRPTLPRLDAPPGARDGKARAPSPSEGSVSPGKTGGRGAIPVSGAPPLCVWGTQPGPEGTNLPASTGGGRQEGAPGSSTSASAHVRQRRSARPAACLVRASARHRASPETRPLVRWRRRRWRPT